MLTLHACLSPQQQQKQQPQYVRLCCFKPCERMCILHMCTLCVYYVYTLLLFQLPKMDGAMYWCLVSHITISSQHGYLLCSCHVHCYRKYPFSSTITYIWLQSHVLNKYFSWKYYIHTTHFPFSVSFVVKYIVCMHPSVFT